MPRGYKISERERNFILDLNAQRNEDGHPKFSFCEISIACGLCERSVAHVVRVYAAEMRRQERHFERLDNLVDRERG